MAAHDDITKKHLRGSALLFAGRLLALLINFVVQVLTVRYLPKADYGVFAFALSVVMVTSVVVAFGMDKAASRFLPVYLEKRDYGRFWGAIALQLATVATLGLVAVALFVTAWKLDWPMLATDARTRTVLAIVIGLAICEAFDGVLLAVFAVLASPAAIFVRRHLLGPLLKLAAAGTVVFVGGDVYAFATGQLVAGLLGLAACVAILVRLLGGRVAPQLDAESRSDSATFTLPVRETFGYGATLLSGDLSYLLRIALVPLVLGVYAASEDVATYQAVMPLARLNEIVLMTFSVLFLPSAAKLAASDRRTELQRLFEQTNVWITLLSFPVFAVSFVAASWVPVLLFGGAYRDSGEILRWLAIGFFTNAAFGTSLRLLRSVAKLGTLIAVDLAVVAVAIGLVAWLVPRYGAVGGAWAVCGAYVFQTIAYLLAVWRSTHVTPFAPQCWTPYLVGMALAVAGRAIADGPEAQLAAAVVVSLLMLGLFARNLELVKTFPELGRLWNRVAGAESAKPQTDRRDVPASEVS